MGGSPRALPLFATRSLTERVGERIRRRLQLLVALRPKKRLFGGAGRLADGTLEAAGTGRVQRAGRDRAARAYPERPVRRDGTTGGQWPCRTWLLFFLVGTQVTSHWANA